MQDRTSTREIVELATFGHYLRTGEWFDVDELVEVVERKFNPYHDPDDGRFTFKPGGGSLALRVRSTIDAVDRAVQRGDRPVPLEIVPPPAPKPKARPSTPPKPVADPVAKRQRNIGALSAKYESTKLEGPGTISSGRNDPGGVSYGTFQLSSTRRKIHEFVASPKASTWSAQFRGKEPATRQFDDQWRAVAAADPVGFEAAQRAFIVRTNYSDGAQRVRQASGYELETASPAVRQAFFSTAVQHGPTGGSGLFVESIRLVAGKMERTDPRYESVLINTLYDRRIEQRRGFAAAARSKADRLTKLRQFDEAAGLLGKARLADNDVNRRYPRERYDALLLLSGQPMSKY